MSSIGTTAVAVALVIGALPAVAAAGPVRHHHVARHKVYRGVYATWPRYAYGPAFGDRYGRAYGPTSASPYPLTAADDPYSPYAAPGAAIRALARRNQYAPGVTNELAPDNIATATGGPSGGVPGFSGH